jgi:hypothetical protein
MKFISKVKIAKILAKYILRNKNYICSAEMNVGGKFNETIINIIFKPKKLKYIR